MTSLNLLLLFLLLILNGCKSKPDTLARASVPERVTDASAVDGSRSECDAKTNLGMSDGYTQYKCSDGRWVVDEEAMERQRKYDAHRRELVWAFRSRVLTDAEMEEVEQAGTYLLTHAGQSYSSEELEKQYNGLILQQFRIRIAASKVRP